MDRESLLELLEAKGAEGLERQTSTKPGKKAVIFCFKRLFYRVS